MRRMGVSACRRMGDGHVDAASWASGHYPVLVHQVHSVHYVHLLFGHARRVAVSSVLIYPVFELDQRTLDLIDPFS